MHVRVLYTVGGGHTHVRVFVGAAENLTHGKAGDLTFTNEEWTIVSRQWAHIGWQVEEDDQRMLGPIVLASTPSEPGAGR